MLSMNNVKPVPSSNPAPKLPSLLANAPPSTEVREPRHMSIEMSYGARVLSSVQV
jgi:hypothetical protein